MKEIIKRLRELDACKEGLNWLAEQPDPKTAWEACEKGPDLLWLCARLSEGPKSPARLKLVRVLNECIGYFVCPTATADAVANAVYAANAAYAAHAAYTAAYTTNAAYAANAAYDLAMRRQANIVRKHYSFDEILEQLKGVKT
jgi:hypothetical protein